MDHPADPPPVAAATTTDPPPSTDPPTEPSSSTTKQPGTSTVPDLRPFSMFTAGSANQNTTATLVDDEDEDDDAHSVVTISTADSTDDHRVRQSQFALPPLGAASNEKPMEWDPFESSAPPPPPPPSEPVPMMATMAMPEPQVPTGPRAPDVQIVQMPTPVVQPPGGYMPTAVQVQPPGVSVLPPSYAGPTATAPPPYTGVFGQSTYTPSAFSTAAQPAAEKSMSATPATPKNQDLEKNNSTRENTFCYLGACSAFSIYWCCMLLLFVIPLGGILIFFWWSSRIQVALDGVASVASSASAPDANSLLFNMTVKVKITNKNSSPIQIREVVTDTWFGGSGGFIQKKEIGRGRVANNITVPGHGESTVSVPVQMRFETSTDPGFAALEQVARGCGRVSGGKRDIDMQVKVGVGATINERQLRTGVADTVHVSCPLADDFKSDLLTKVVDDLKKKDGTA